MKRAANAAKRSWLPLVLALACLAGSFVVLHKIKGATIDPGTRTPCRFELPAGFAGNIKILYETADAPALPIENGYRVIRIPPARTAIVETSSPAEYGNAVDIYLRSLPGGGYEELGLQWIAVRKNGLEGDNKEFFKLATELEDRDLLYREAGRTDPDGTNILGRPYEIIVIRENL